MAPNSRKIIICGLGGQGVIFLTRLLARAAVDSGHPVMVSETHGMSQRGGSVISHLKIGGNQAPLIQPGTADALLSLDPDEAVRNLHYLSPGAAAFVNAHSEPPPDIRPHLERLDIRLHCLPANRIALELGNVAVANVVLAGFASRHPALGLSSDDLRRALHTNAKRNLELNLKALERGVGGSRE